MSGFYKFLENNDLVGATESFKDGARVAFYDQEKKISDQQSEIDQLKAEKEKLELELSQTKQVLNNVIDMERNKVEKLKAENAGLERDKSELFGVISDALEAFNDGEFNYCQKQLQIHVKTLRGEHE